MNFLDPQLWFSLVTLTLLEIVLGIDNIIFISIVVGKVEPSKQALARQIGLGGALIMRIILILCITWIVKLTYPLFTLFEVEFSWKSIILLAGGLFLLAKGTYEIHHTVEGEDDVKMGVTRSNSLFSTITQIMVLDIVFSLDSVITAVGMTQVIPIMITAVVIAILVMLLAAGPVSDFIANHPTTKMLALSFLLLVGVALIADGLHFHIPRGYLYFAISFSILVEVLNLWAKNHRIKKQTQSTQ